jgi:hypothetical protein
MPYSTEKKSGFYPLTNKHMRSFPVKMILCLLFAAPIVSRAQRDTVFTEMRTLPGQYSYFTADNLDNIYLVSNGNQLKKITARGDSAGVFNDVRQYGRLDYMDVTNPLKLLLYYRQFATIAVLDRFLNIRNVINLRRQNIFNVKAIGTSYDNNIWIFDEGDARIKRIGENGEVLMTTVDLRQVFDTLPSPTQLTDRDGFVYLYDPEKGFYIFDYYGAFKSRIPLLHWQDVAVIGKTLYGFEGNMLQQYPVGSLQLKSYPLPAAFSDAVQKMAGKERVYLMRKTGIVQYRVQ